MQSVMPPPGRRPTTVPLFLPVLLSIIAAGLLLPAAWFASQTVSYQREARRVTGTVVELYRSGGSSSVRAVVRYRVGDERYEVIADVSQSPPPYEVGDEVEVMYQPGQPQEGRINSFVENWFLTLMLGCFGSLLLLVSAIAWVLWAKKVEINTTSSMRR